MRPAEELKNSIRKFLDSSSEPRIQYCQNCGGILRHAMATFYFDGCSWEVPLPVCAKCTLDVACVMDLLHAA
jgi:hypothetical protein